MRLQGRVDRFQFRFRDSGLGGLSRSVLEHSHASVITDIAPFGHVVAGRILQGTYTCRMGPDEITAAPGDWFLIDPDLSSDDAFGRGRVETGRLEGRSARKVPRSGQGCQPTRACTGAPGTMSP